MCLTLDFDMLFFSLCYFTTPQLHFTVLASTAVYIIAGSTKLIVAMSLFQDERNFLRDPPSGVPFHFESESMYPVALATLQEDKNLSKMRFQLVPKK